MAWAPSFSVSVECVNLCELRKGECFGLSCAWKVPRVLTGFFASTTQAQPICLHNVGRDRSRGRRGSRIRFSSSAWRNGDLELDESNKYVRSSTFTMRWKSELLPSSRKGRRPSCSHSSSSPSSNTILPEKLWEDLKPAISYLPHSELNLIHGAFKLAFEAHDGQKRRSGEPFIIHPVEVARILGDLEMDWESIAAGLLHDTVEDTNIVTFERIETEFGSTVRRIVEGETKVSKLGKLQCANASESAKDVKADDLWQMFLAMTEEVRVIIVKLADRLHNMRTLSHMPRLKQSSIALETLQVFAPLAKLLGMYQIKAELENLSFMYTNEHEYAEINKRLRELYKEHEKDIQELRIIIHPKPCVGVGPLSNAQQICYHVLGLVHGIWTPVPRTMKDYIATPKPNGYQSLHTIVIPFLYESMFRLEVQIRTEEMDLIAERGITAYYSGQGCVGNLVGHNPMSSRKSIGKTACLDNAGIALRIGWLNAIREWQEEFVGNMSSGEFVDTITRDLLGSRVFVFTPKGVAGL